MVRPKAVGERCPRMWDTAATVSTPIVLSVTPPATDAEAPPMNISSMMAVQASNPSAPRSTVVSPAVRLMV